MTAGGSMAAANALIVAAARGTRVLSADELQRVLEQVSRAGFSPAPLERVGGRVSGVIWRGRMLKGSDTLPSAEVHYLRHVIVRREWPTGTTLPEYETSIQAVLLDPDSGILSSQLHGQWQLTAFRRSGLLRGPRGYEWLMVEYRVSLGHWVTAFQLEAGLTAILQSRERRQQRWLRQPM